MAKEKERDYAQVSFFTITNNETRQISIVIKISGTEMKSKSLEKLEINGSKQLLN